MGVLVSSSVLSLGMFSSVANASSTVGEQPEKVRIEVASTELVVTKNDLIKKFKELFPNQFDFLTASDFHMSNGHFYPEDGDDTVRHELSAFKTVNGKQLYASVGFVGENLDIDNFHYQPLNEKDALFPAKVSKDGAQKIAADFVKQFSDGKDYQLQSNPFDFYFPQLLSEPIRYSFSFARMEKQVPIADQTIEVSVLGNGEIVSFYRNSTKTSKSTFEDKQRLKEKNDLVAKFEDNLTANLHYQIGFDYQTSERTVQLVYQPTLGLQGIHATSGKWLTANGYSADFPKATKTELIAASPLPAKRKGVTLEEAKKIAQNLLASKSDKVKLSIESIEETEREDGQAIIRIHYMYHYANGGTGTGLEINKATGEITQYSDISSEMLGQLDEKTKKEDAISQQAAVTKALSYLKEWVPSYLHNYAMPITEPYFDKNRGMYSISFPRVVNGIAVMGDDITVGITADGSLNSLYVNYQEVEEWPAPDKVISKEAAKVILKDALNLKLTYTKPVQDADKHHYDLVYIPEFNEQAFSFLDASTGEWHSMWNRKNSTVISHPWAQEELNYLIQTNILDVKDSEKFNGDAPVSKGEALKVIMNSLSYFYAGRYYYAEENTKQTFTNIDTKHPYYQVVERAVESGIIYPVNQSLDVDSPITREELAALYIRVLGLEQAAKDGSIYKLNFADADKVSKEYSGYVALANSLGVLKADDNKFNPVQQVSYAELAVTTIRLAHKMAESGKRLGY